MKDDISDVEEIRHDRITTGVLFALSLALSGFAVPYALTTLVALPATMVAGFSSLVATELLWRDRVRPRLLWNHSGVTLVHSYTTRTVRWSDIDDVRVRLNLIEFMAGNELYSWECDRNVATGLMLRRYGQRLDRHLELMRERWSNDTVHEDLPRSDTRRPALLYVAMIAAAAACAFLTLSPLA